MKVFLRTLMRRWPIFLIVLALAIGGTYSMVGRVGPTYESVGSALIFPPSDPDGPGPSEPGGNPYLELSGLTQARDIVIRTLTSKSVRTEVEEAYPGMSFEATPDFTNSAPIILFTVEAETPEASTQALTDLIGRVPTTLADLQSNQALTDRARITSRTLTEDSEPTTVRKAQIRAAILVGAGILAVGLLFIALLDGMLAVRRRRRAEVASEISDAAPDDELVDDQPRVQPGIARSRWPVLPTISFRRRRVEGTSEPATNNPGEVVEAEETSRPPEHADEFPLVTAYSSALGEFEQRSEVAAEQDEPEQHEPEQPARLPLIVAYTTALREVDKAWVVEGDDLGGFFVWDETDESDETDETDRTGDDAWPAPATRPLPTGRRVAVVDLRRARDMTTVTAAFTRTPRNRKAWDAR